MWWFTPHAHWFRCRLPPRAGHTTTQQHTAVGCSAAAPAAAAGWRAAATRARAATRPATSHHSTPPLRSGTGFRVMLALAAVEAWRSRPPGTCSGGQSWQRPWDGKAARRTCSREGHAAAACLTRTHLTTELPLNERDLPCGTPEQVPSV